MAPKAAPPPPVAEPVVHIPEEDEEGEGKVAFRLALAGVTDLPCPLETLVAFGGLCRENRSAPAAESESPAEFELPKDKFIRKLGQELCDDVVSKQLEISLCDAANENALIGKASISLLPLLHDQTEVFAELELQLTEAYHIKWWPEKEAELLEAAGGKDKKAAAGKAKAKAKPGAPGDEAPELLKRPEGFVPPRTIIRFSVRVDELVGPAEDRKDWTTLTMKVVGAFALPDRLTTLGLASPADEVELHQLKYRAMCFGAVLENGELARPKEENPEAPAAAEGEEAAEAPAPTEAEARERAERFGRSVQFKEPVVVRYRGARFLREFRQMLNSTGGTWVYFVPEERTSNDPKKPNLPEVGSLSKHFVGKAWVDLRALIRPGARATEACCELRTAAVGAEVMEEEPTLQASRAFVRLALELRGAPVAEPEPPIEDLRVLAPPRKPLGKFPASSEASLMYREAVEASFAAICRDAGAGAAGAAAAVQQLKKAGSYDDLRENLRGAVIRVFRERMRKDTSAVPGKLLQGEVRDELVSGTYTHLKEAAEAVLEEIRLHELASAGARAPAAAAQLPLEPESPNYFRSEADNGEPGGLSPVAAGGGVAEEARTQRAREVLVAASDVAGRNARLAFEAELSGSWPRAAEMLQSRLLLDEVRCQPKEWIAYAKFCARARGRQAAAEEALRQAVQLIAEGVAPNSREDEQEVDMMLACLLLDRGRHDEAIRVFREWHLKAPSDPTFKFFLGLGLFLADEEPVEALRLLNAVGGGRLEPYTACLEKLLDYGLPSLAFTFLDQCKVLPDTAQNEPSLVLIDARASCLDRDFSAAVTRAEQLTMSKGGEKATGSAAQEAWRLQGECFFQLGDMDRALQSLNQAMTFERKFEEPGFFIRLGSVLVAKKRWKQAREAYLKSIQFLPTAEAWSGVAYAEYRSDELQMCYEALNEANLLDNERSDVWALLALVHLRLENWTQASHGFKQCLKLKADCEDLLLEVAAEFSRGPPGQSRQPDFAESAARRAMELRDSGQAHAALAEALVVQGKALEAADEARAAMERLVDQPEPRKGIYDRALRWCDELGRHDLVQALHDLQRSCDQKAKRSP